MTEALKNLKDELKSLLQTIKDLEKEMTRAPGFIKTELANLKKDYVREVKDAKRFYQDCLADDKKSLADYKQEVVTRTKQIKKLEGK